MRLYARGLQPAQVTIHTTFLGGGLGRKAEQDFIAQAVQVAMKIGKPVKLIGVGEKMAEVFLGPVLVKAFDLAGGGVENWFAYVLALVFLLFRPQGLFGEKIIDRV